MGAPRLANGITVKQEAFAQGVAVQHLSLHDAYLAAGYSEGNNGDTIDSHASRLAADDRVAARISKLQERLAVLADINVASVAEEMEDARVVARQAEIPQVASMIAASKAKANLVGLLQPVVKVESRSINIDVALDGMTVDELRELIAFGDAAEAIESKALGDGGGTE